MIDKRYTQNPQTVKKTCKEKKYMAIKNVWWKSEKVKEIELISVKQGRELLEVQMALIFRVT